MRVGANGEWRDRLGAETQATVQQRTSATGYLSATYRSSGGSPSSASPGPAPTSWSAMLQVPKVRKYRKANHFCFKKKMVFASKFHSLDKRRRRHKLVRRVRGGHAQERESHRRHAPRTIVSARGSLIAALLPLQGENKLAALAEQEGASLEDRATMAEKILKSPL